MSMDDQYQQLIRFTRALEQFNEIMLSSLQELEASHTAIASLWQDEMRQQYDLQWTPLHDMLTRYVRVEGGRYLDFLQVKIRYLERYLYGG